MKKLFYFSIGLILLTGILVCQTVTPKAFTIWNYDAGFSNIGDWTYNGNPVTQDETVMIFNSSNQVCNDYTSKASYLPDKNYWELKIALNQEQVTANVNIEGFVLPGDYIHATINGDPVLINGLKDFQIPEDVINLSYVPVLLASPPNSDL